MIKTSKIFKNVLLLLFFATAIFSIFCVKDDIALKNLQENSLIFISVQARTADAEDELAQSVTDNLDALDLSAIEQLIKEFTDAQKSVFDTTSVLTKIKMIINGEIAINYPDIFSYILQLLGIKALEFLPTLASIIAIVLGFSILTSIKGKFATESVQNIAHFACVAAVLIILIVQVSGLISQTAKFITNIKNLTSAVFPVLLTLMTAIGATSSVAIYQPSVAVFSTSIIQIVSMCVLPCILASFALSIVGNISDKVKLNKLSDFFGTISKWLLTVLFFVFIAFLSLQGITASVYDSISVRTAKFAISKYIPLIGGYLSEGFNLVMAGSVLIKNAVGLSAILVLVISVLPLIINLIVCSLGLKLCAAIIEPMGDSKTVKLLENTSKHISLLIAVVFAITFLLFIFILLIIATGNLAL